MTKSLESWGTEGLKGRSVSSRHCDSAGLQSNPGIDIEPVDMSGELQAGRVVYAYSTPFYERR